MFVKTIRNLTPHDLTVVDEQGNTRTIPTDPSGLYARVETTRVKTGEILGIPTYAVQYGEVGLFVTVEGKPKYYGPFPEPKDGVVLVVSGLVRSALNGRPDVYSPGELIRDEAGKVIGCRGFDGNRE